MYICVIIGIVIFILGSVGVPYILGAKKSQNCYNVDSKRSYVVANLERFKVNNEGSSLDEKEVYLVDHSRIGL